MMDHLIRLAESFRPGLQDRLRSAFGENAIRGALLEVDRFWFEDYCQHFFSWHPCDWELPGRQFQLNYRSFSEPLEWNFEIRRGHWESHCQIMGYRKGASPIIVRVILRHPQFPKDRDLPQE